MRVVAADDRMFLWPYPATLKYPPSHSTVLRLVDNLLVHVYIHRLTGVDSSRTNTSRARDWAIVETRHMFG